MQKLQFDYYRGLEADQFSFYRVPKLLFTAECFKGLSCEAKILYGLMLDRMGLSIKNKWFDEKDRVYIIFTVAEVIELLGCSRQKAIKNIAELDSEKGIGLIEKKRLGFGKPNVIYVKNFIIDTMPEPADKEDPEPENVENTQKYENHTSRSSEIILQEVPKSNFKKYENHTSRSSKIILQEVPKSNCNNTDNNNTEYSNTDMNNPISSNPISEAEKMDRMGEIEIMEKYRDVIKTNIRYSYHAGDVVDDLVELMVDVMMMPDDGTICISGINRPIKLVKSQFMKLNYEHIEYVLLSLQKNTNKIGNIKQYLLAALYNAPLTIHSFYQQEVNHDLYG